MLFFSHFPFISIEMYSNGNQSDSLMSLNVISISVQMEWNPLRIGCQYFVYWDYFGTHLDRCSCSCSASAFHLISWLHLAVFVFVCNMWPNRISYIQGETLYWQLYIEKFSMCSMEFAKCKYIMQIIFLNNIHGFSLFFFILLQSQSVSTRQSKYVPNQLM